MGGLLHLVQRGGAWAEPQPVQAPPRCTKCNNPPINGHCSLTITVLLNNGTNNGQTDDQSTPGSIANLTLKAGRQKLLECNVMNGKQHFWYNSQKFAILA